MPYINLGKRKPRDRSISKDRHQKIYNDKRWWRLRDAKKRANPLCEKCEAEGRITQTQAVHHIIPFETGSTPEMVERLAFDYNNLMSVCNECHSILDNLVKRNRNKGEKM